MLRPSPTEAARLLRRAKVALWRAGSLTWKLHSSQRVVYSLILAAIASGAARYVLEIARRWGKTWLLVLMSVETAIRNPGCRIVYGAPTLKDLQEFIIPTIEAITADAPQGLRWAFNSQTMHFTCENGSYLHLFGCDDKRKANRGRGPGAIFVVLDECGFIPILKYVIQSVLRPQLLHSGGALLLGSTPAEEPDHDFTEIAARAEANGNFAKRTIYDNPLLTPERIATFIAADAKDEGLTPEAYKLTDTFRREYLAERVVNKLLVVLPEWEEARTTLIQRVERPEFYDAMTVLDPGGNDPHAVSFGYWHFKAAKYVQEDELLLRDGENTEDLAARVKQKERELWGVDLWDGTLRAAVEDETGAITQTVPEWMQEVLMGEARPQPYVRWMDINISLSRDLYQLHKLVFINTAKDDKAVQVNNLRVAIRRGEYLLDPRCVHTDRHFRATTWKDLKRTDYARKAGEHGDLLDTAVYAMRNVSRQRNPYPRGWNVAAGTNTAAAMAEARREKTALPPLRTARLRRQR